MIKKQESMKRKATAVWQGNGMEGKGSLTSTSGVLNNTPYSFLTRFKNEDGIAGTNPEELIAAAHAGCYAMALSFMLSGAGFVADELKVDAAVSIDLVGDHFEITGINLDLGGKVPGITSEKFIELANSAKVNCPVSQALKSVNITLSAKLV
jgi:lipoyl-dependent peroxiredoxin